MTLLCWFRKIWKEDAEGIRDRMIKDYKTSKEYELEESNNKVWIFKKEIL
jgi:glutamate mutase epsilon subunit